MRNSQIKSYNNPKNKQYTQKKYQILIFLKILSESFQRRSPKKVYLQKAKFMINLERKSEVKKNE